MSNGATFAFRNGSLTGSRASWKMSVVAGGGFLVSRDTLASSPRPPAGALHLVGHHADDSCEDVSRSNPKRSKARTSVLRFVDVFTRYHVQ